MSEYFLILRKQLARFLNPKSLRIRLKEASENKKRNILIIIILVLCMRLFFYDFFDQNAYAKKIEIGKNVSAETADPMNKIDKGIVNPEKNDSENDKYCEAEKNDKISAEKNAISSERKEKLEKMVGGYPISEMIPYIVERDEKTAAFLVAIARKESSWGVHAPSKKGRDCYNYWGYKGNYNLSMGYSCFDSPEQAVNVVGDKIESLIDKKIDTPEKLVVWKCGSSCKGHSPESVKSWIGSVRQYWQKMMS